MEACPKGGLSVITCTSWLVEMALIIKLSLWAAAIMWQKHVRIVTVPANPQGVALPTGGVGGPGCPKVIMENSAVLQYSRATLWARHDTLCHVI